MKSAIFKLCISFILFSIAVDSVNPSEFVAEKFNELKKLKEINFKHCCFSKGIPNECSQFCTYDLSKFSNPMELAKSLNPGWFLMHYFLPGKCYLSELEHFLPCLIEEKDVTECCKDISKIHELIETFPQISEFKEFLPKQKDVSTDPKWCSNICAGKSFEITPKSIFSCSSTIKAAFACFWHENIVSAENLTQIFDFIQKNGIPETLEKAVKMLKALNPEMTKAVMEKPEILIQGLKLAGATEAQIIKVKDFMQQIIQEQN
uniref:Uncharacterized protein n=1 Tax=Panagrolaimus sp. PS1159 TaxID=55785 RepID=A0AC35FP07_9BILA